MDQKINKNNKKMWYKYPMVWFVISLPMIAVVASIATLIIAAKHPPNVIEHNVSYKTQQVEKQD